MLVPLRLLGLIILSALLAYVINPKWMAWAEMALPDWVRWGAAAVGVVEIGLFTWIFRTLGSNITSSVETRRQHQLIREGPYRWVRHPLYTVGFAFWVTLALVSANWFLLAAMLPVMLVIGLRTPLEEAQLVERFGEEYREYQRMTGRYLPRVRRLFMG